MSGHDLIAESPPSSPDPVVVALEGCRHLDRLPALGELVTGMVSGLAGLPEVTGAAVLVKGSVEGTPAAHWSRSEARCALAGAGAADVKWIKVSEAWEEKIWSRMDETGESPPRQGSGAVGLEGLPPGPWWVQGIRVQGEWLLAMLLVLKSDAAANRGPEGAAQLRRMALVMEPVLSVWAEATVLRIRLRQVTAERRALARINELQGRFVAMASHEFKTPLTSITAYADVLLGKVTDEQFPQATEFLGVIKQEADRLLRMINRILDFSRLEFGSRLLDLKLLDLEPLVRETVRSLMPGINEKHQRVSISAPHNLPRVKIDADLIRQVLVNLVGNAVKYTPGGGTIELDLSEQSSTVAVAVRDDGPGISDADMKRIFNEFYRADSGQEGTGLGLSIARHIVNLHGGHITVGPLPAGGTEFTFLLPKAASMSAPLPSYLARHGEPEQLQNLMVNLLRLLAELTASPLAILILRDGQGRLSPVCALGLDPLAQAPDPWPETPAWSRILEAGGPLNEQGSWPQLAGDLGWVLTHRQVPRLMIPVGRHGKALGCVILGRRPGQRSYGGPDEDLAAVLAGITANVLSGLEGGLGKILTAIRALTQVKRWGIPTATAEALGLIRGLAGDLGLDEDRIAEIQCAATLHDAGMIRLEEDLLQEEGPLAWDQKDEIARHIEHGLELVAPLIKQSQVKVVIRHHHEWFDGSGYPDGLKGEAIPLGARVLAAVDAWYSMTTERPYRKGMAPAAALREIETHAGSQFDPAVVSALTGRLSASGGVGNRNLHHVTHPQE